jgi:TatD DNase family protein
MYHSIFDTHAHYDDEKFNEDRDGLLKSLPSKGVVNIINCGCDLASSLKSIEFSEEYDYFYSAVGVHPSNITGDSYDELQKIRELYSHPKCVAVGEIGLEYHYDFVPKDKQLDIFEKQIILANELELPVIVHDREAHEDTMNLLKRYKPKGVVHCFSGSAEMAKEVLKLGMYIGLGGAVTFKNARKPLEVAEIVPEDRLLLETDCPYMTPVPHRGKRNDPSFVPIIAQCIADARGEDADALAKNCLENGKMLFGIS